MPKLHWSLFGRRERPGEQPQRYPESTVKLLRNTSLADRLQQQMQEGWPAGVLFFDIVHFFEFEQLYGEVLAQRVIELLRNALDEKVPDFLPDTEILAVENLWGDDFAVVFVPPGEPNRSRLSDLAVALKVALQHRLNQDVLRVTGQGLELHVGYALLPPRAGGWGNGGLEKRLYAAVREAQQVAKGKLDLETLQLLDEFRGILDRRLITVVYQPVVNLASGTVLGWEALARGPEDSHFRTPDVLFNFAEEAGLLFSLERVCREQALHHLGELAPAQKLFLNIHPRTICDPNFTRGETMQLIRELGLEPYNVVFEITERHNVGDYTVLNRTLEHYRSQGYLVAVDDVGTGYSGLQAIAEIRPNFLKVDMSLVRGVDANPVKRALLETLVSFADKIGSAIIAEGIETRAELVTLLTMGVHYGQGYFLARPAHPKPDLVPEIGQFVGRNCRGCNGYHRSHPIGGLAEPALQVEPSTLVEDVKGMLNDNEPINGVVVVDRLRPVGLIMRHHLDRLLGSHYGVALYYHRAVSQVMDPAPMVVDAETPVAMVAEAAMNREKPKLYDYVIVTRDGSLAGVVSVQKMLDFITRWQIELAKGANPLTGLPGNIAIEREIEIRGGRGESFSLAYADLDHFKSYNDRYGFENGDRLLLLVARLITRAIRRYGRPSDFAGHIGGDDFVIISTPERIERICQAVVRCFKRLVKDFYRDEDRRRGAVHAPDRDGRVKEFPLVAISMGIIDCAGACDARAVAERAAEVKRYAKTVPGSKYVRDRRGQNLTWN
ncbi:MAG: EAL domain-containing protein [Bacillota bacterium]|nr:EAL domain-containing protein [Bacillota bacterium]